MAGWYKEDTFTNVWTFNTDTVTQAETLYAKCTYTATLKNEDNAVQATTASLDVEKWQLPADGVNGDCVAPHTTFDHWSKTIGGAAVAASDINGNTTLYAVCN